MRMHKVATIGILMVVLTAGFVLGWTVSTVIMGVIQFESAADQPFGDFVVQTQSPYTDNVLGSDMGMMIFEAIKASNEEDWFLPGYDMLTEWISSRPWFAGMTPRVFNLMDGGVYLVELDEAGYSIACSLLGVDFPSFLRFNKSIEAYADRIEGQGLEHGIIISTEMRQTIEELQGSSLKKGDLLKITLNGRRMVEVPYLGDMPYNSMLWDFPRRWNHTGYIDCQNLLTLLGYTSSEMKAGSPNILTLGSLDLETLSITPPRFEDTEIRWHQLCVRILPGADINAAMQETQAFLSTVDAYRASGDVNYTKAVFSEKIAESSFAYLNETYGYQQRISDTCLLVGLLALLILGELQYLLYFKETGLYSVCRLLGCRRSWLARYILAQTSLYLLPAGLLGYATGCIVSVINTWNQLSMILFNAWIPMIGIGMLLFITISIACFSLLIVTRVSPIQALANGEVLG